MEFFSALSLDSPNAHLVIRGEFDASSIAQVRRAELGGLSELSGLDLTEDAHQPLRRVVSIDRNGVDGALDFSTARQKTGTGS